MESPTKISTIKKLLNGGGNFIFVATLGHIMDLPERSLGVNLDTFEPMLAVVSKKRKLLERLAEMSKKVDLVYLATDPDREGEAISYHLKHYLSQRNRNLKFARLDLIEITERGLMEAFKNQRDVDETLYLSWKARRVLDRLIGYSLSPYLSKLFQRPLSAGRVQTPALRLIVEREEEIENFVPKITYSLKVKAQLPDGTPIFLELYKENSLFKSYSEEILSNFYDKYLRNRYISLFDVVKKQYKSRAPLPLKTSTLIEVSGKRLGFSPKQTMRLAQDLYEEGFITYMRTDSTRVSAQAKREARAYIKNFFGEAYLGRERRQKKGIFVQDAHECIRPTSVERERVGISPSHQKLYELIRAWFLASFMKDAEYLEQRYLFRGDEFPRDYYLTCSKKVLLFDGFLRVLGYEEKENSETFEVPQGVALRIRDFEIVEHRTRPPERYTPHGLIKKLEALGIGRPSTYAQVVDNLLKRGYAVLEKSYLKPTELGRKVCRELIERAPIFVDYSFTAQMERTLDEIRETERDYQKTLSEYYRALKEATSL